MTYVYLLSDYDEHGSEHVTATLDRSKLLDLVDQNWPGDDEYGLQWKTEGKNGLTELLKLSDQELVKRDGNNCHSGWGGMQLHVVELK